MQLPLRCIVCGEQPEDSGLQEGINQPHAATAFTSHGHYGSTAFDPMDGSFIEVNVCDPCLVAAAADGKVAEGRDRYLAETMQPLPAADQPALKPWSRS